MTQEKYDEFWYQSYLQLHLTEVSSGPSSHGLVDSDQRCAVHSKMFSAHHRVRLYSFVVLVSTHYQSIVSDVI